jgi:hypothetical protein
MTPKETLADLDRLMIAIGLALAASAPGPAGEAGAVAAISFDIARRRWGSAAFSVASMVPVVGYLPAFLKVAWLLFILDRRLKTLEEMLPELHRSIENVEALRDSFGKYYRRLPKMRITRTLRARLERIMAIENLNPARAVVSGSPESDTSSYINSAK